MAWWLAPSFPGLPGGDEDGILPCFPHPAQPSRRAARAPSQGRHGGLGSRFGLKLEKQKEGNSLAPFFFCELFALQPVLWFGGLKGFL